MQQIWEFTDYREALKYWFSSQPQEGYGQASRLSEHLKATRTLVSQVLKGEREFSMEQGHGTSQFMGLSESQADYFLTLVQIRRAGTKGLRRHYQVVAEKMREAASAIQTRANGAEIDASAKQKFYSDYSHSAIRLATELPSLNSVKEISDYLNIPVNQVEETMEFLLKYGLVKSDGMNLQLGASATHIPKNDPLVVSHHRNWRVEGVRKLGRNIPDDLFFTAPASIDEETDIWLKRSLLELVEELSKRALSVKPTKLVCLNFDYFYLTNIR